MMKYFKLSPVRNKPRPVRKRFSNGVNKAVGLLQGKSLTILKRKRQTGMNISNGVKIIGLVCLFLVSSIVFNQNSTFARMVRTSSELLERLRRQVSPEVTVEELSFANILERIADTGTTKAFIYILPLGEIPTNEQLENPVIKEHGIDIFGIDEQGKLRLIVGTGQAPSILESAIRVYFHCHGRVVPTFDPLFESVPLIPSPLDWEWIINKQPNSRTFLRVANEKWLFEFNEKGELSSSPDKLEILIYRRGKVEPEHHESTWLQWDEEFSRPYFESLMRAFSEFRILDLLRDENVYRYELHFGDGKQIIFDRSLTPRGVILEIKEEIGG